MPAGAPRRRGAVPLLHGWARLAGILGGCVVAAGGIAAALASGLGVGPYDLAVDGLAGRLGVSFGTAGVGLSLLVTIVGRLLGGPVGPGTVATVLLIGPAVDAWSLLLPDLDGVLAGAGLLGGGMVLIAFGVSLIVAARHGAGPMEVLMLAIARRGVPLRWARTGLEVATAVTGWLLGGQVGVGTVVIALGLGHLLAVFVPSEETAAPAGALRWRLRAPSRANGRGGASPPA